MQQRAEETTQAALAWARSVGCQATEIEHLAGDLSARSYYRLRGGNGTSHLLAHYPEELRSSCARFARTTELLTGVGIRTPAIEGIACDRGWMLLEDLGPETLFDWGPRGWDFLEPYFRQTVEVIRALWKLAPEQVAGLSPALDGELLRRELEMTRTVFLEPRHLLDTATLGQTVDKLFDELCEQLVARPLIPCHRDLMARNLIGLENGNVAVIDHQDLRLGPRFYDLASLMNDSLFPPATVREPLLESLFETPEDRLDYHHCAAQRTLKAVGSFAAFSQRGNPRYEPLIPRMLDLALEHLSVAPKTRDAAERLKISWRDSLPQSRS